MDEELATWIRHVCTVLELPTEVAEHEQLLLDVARDVAHNVLRPAAPLTTFLVGLAAGRAGATRADIEQTATVVSALAAEWPKPDSR